LLSIFSNAADKSKDSLHKVFEDRYDSKQMMNADLFKEKLNYIHNNPCTSKWKLAERPEDYRHSSASNYINGSGVYDVELDLLISVYILLSRQSPGKTPETLTRAKKSGLD
jgi:hypothetical protein